MMYVTIRNVVNYYMHGPAASETHVYVITGARIMCKRSDFSE